MVKSFKILTFSFFILLLLPSCKQIQPSDPQTMMFRMDQQDFATLTDVAPTNDTEAISPVEGLISVKKDSSLGDNSGFVKRGVIVNKEEQTQTKTEPIEKPEEKTSTIKITPTIKLSKTEYNQNEKIDVNYSNMPGNAKDWIGVFKANDKDENYIQYFYTNANKSGTLSFNTLPVGNYEVRVYFNDSYKVEGKTSFSVQGNTTTQVFIPASNTPSVTSTTTKATSYSNSEYDSIPAITNKYYNSNMWRDMDEDGDLDVIMYTDGKVADKALENAAMELEKGSFGKLDITFIRGTKAQSQADKYGGYITTEVIDDYLGWSTYGPNAQTRLATRSPGNIRIALHEMMHVVCVLLDVKVNNKDSIMDYDYGKTFLSKFDKGVLKYIYKDVVVKSNANNRPTFTTTAWHIK
jgi:hypothetical protein